MWTKTFRPETLSCWLRDRGLDPAKLREMALYRGTYWMPHDLDVGDLIVIEDTPASGGARRLACITKVDKTGYYVPRFETIFADPGSIEDLSFSSAFPIGFYRRADIPDYVPGQ